MSGAVLSRCNEFLPRPVAHLNVGESFSSQHELSQCFGARHLSAVHVGVVGVSARGAFAPSSVSTFRVDVVAPRTPLARVRGEELQRRASSRLEHRAERVLGESLQCGFDALIGPARGGHARPYPGRGARVAGAGPGPHRRFVVTERPPLVVLSLVLSVGSTVPNCQFEGRNPVLSFLLLVAYNFADSSSAWTGGRGGLHR